MLPSDLLLSRRRNGTLVPHRLPHDADTRALAAEMIVLFTEAVGQRRASLDETLAAFEGEDTAFKVKRGLAHLLQNDFSTFETVAPLDPPELRRRVFALGASAAPTRARRAALLQRAADTLALEQGGLFTAPDIAAGLFADLPTRQVLTAFDPPAPDALIHRFNLAQAQGVFYRAHDLLITAHRNEPARYKQLFRYVKLFGLMTLIEGDADHGFTLRVDGPASLFAPSTRYGLAMAKLLPALLHVTKWSLRASLKPRVFPDDAASSNRLREDPLAADTFGLDAACGLVSHYAPPKEFDSILEEAFAARWEKLDTPWKLEREVDLVPVPGSAIIPDFRVVHPDGRSVLVEIVGYWRPDYLRKKFALVRRSGRRDIVLAVSERLNLDAAGVNLDEFAEQIVWFKGKLDPKAVLARVEAVAASLSPPPPAAEVKKRTPAARRSSRKPPAAPAP